MNHEYLVKIDYISLDLINEDLNTMKKFLILFLPKK